MGKIHTHYDNLKVAPDAPIEVIRAAYRTLSQKHHPDKNPGNPDAERVMKILNEAYAVLGDPAKRAAYDATIRIDDGAAAAARERAAQAARAQAGREAREREREAREARERATNAAYETAAREAAERFTRDARARAAQQAREEETLNAQHRAAREAQERRARGACEQRFRTAPDAGVGRAEPFFTPQPQPQRQPSPRRRDIFSDAVAVLSVVIVIIGGIALLALLMGRPDHAVAQSPADADRTPGHTIAAVFAPRTLYVALSECPVMSAKNPTSGGRSTLAWVPRGEAVDKYAVDGDDIRVSAPDGPERWISSGCLSETP